MQIILCKIIRYTLNNVSSSYIYTEKTSNYLDIGLWIGLRYPRNKLVLPNNKGCDRVRMVVSQETIIEEVRALWKSIHGAGALCRPSIRYLKSANSVENLNSVGPYKRTEAIS